MSKSAKTLTRSPSPGSHVSIARGLVHPSIPVQGSEMSEVMASDLEPSTSTNLGLGVSAKWNKAQFVVVACPFGLLACGAINESGVSGRLAIADGTPEAPLVVPRDLFQAKAHRVVDAVGKGDDALRVGMTGSEIVQLLCPPAEGDGSVLKAEVATAPASVLVEVVELQSAVAKYVKPLSLVVKWGQATASRGEFAVLICENGLVGPEAISDSLLEHFGFAVAIVEGMVLTPADILKAKVKRATKLATELGVAAGMSGSEAALRLSIVTTS